MNYTIIVPVYNRPDEVDELLDSLTRQAYDDMEQKPCFEVIVVEDGSTNKCDEVCAKYADKLDLHYYNKENSGPGQSRNYGAERAKGEWLIILDSDIILPPGYLKAVGQGIADAGGSDKLGAFGGPDASHPQFNDMQKAVSYSMTSFFTTGGIRGGKAKLDKFYPRSYTMGIRKDVYESLGGFSKMRYGEDIDFSYRIVESGNKTALFTDAYVYHKRRTDLRAFFRQVEHSGAARIVLEKLHPGTMKPVHMLPAVFTLGVFSMILISAVGRILMQYDTSAGSLQASEAKWFWLCATPWLPLLLYAFMVCIDSAIRNKSVKVGLLSIATSYTQLMGYGWGFLCEKLRKK